MLSEPYPIEDIEASANDSELQHSNAFADLEPEQRDAFEAIRAKVIQEGASESTSWIYFRSPDWTWQRECGSEGWLLYDAEAQTQHAFLMTAMN